MSELKQKQLATGTVPYTSPSVDNIIPVATFAQSKVNRSSLPKLDMTKTQEEVVISVEAGEKYIYDHRYQLTQAQAEINEKLIINVAEGAVGEMILNYEDDGTAEFLRNSDIVINASKKSQLTIFLVQRLGEQAHSRCRVNVYCDPLSEVRMVVADSGAATHSLDLRADMQERSTFDCQSIYFGRNQERYDYNYNLVHHGILCQSNLLVNGALKDYAKKVFRGTLDFRRGSSGSVGSESEYVTMLDDTVSNIAIPLLLCTEDNVEGNHAASAGRLDQDMVYYVMSRGFSRHEANKLIIASRFAHVLDLLPNSELKNAVLGDILSKLDEA